MTVRELTGALPLTPFRLVQPDHPASSGYVEDLLSWVLGRAGRDAAWFAIMSNQNVVVVALMAEIFCITLTGGATPDGDLLHRAQEEGVNPPGTGQGALDTTARLSGALVVGQCLLTRYHFVTLEANSTRSISTIFIYAPACRLTQQCRAGTPFCFLGWGEPALWRGFRLREAP